MSKITPQLQTCLAGINKKYGYGAIFQLGEKGSTAIPVLSTGNLVIDHALGVGGLPRGRIIEVYGPEASGKTTFCLTAAAQVQREGGVAAIVDVEHAIDPKYAAKLGVDVGELIVSQPDCGEAALDIVESLIESNSVQLIILDSVAALVTKTELDGEMGDATVGVQARLMSSAMRRLTAKISKSTCVCIFTNQIREKVGVMFGNPETTPGGRALKFYSSIRLEIRRISSLKLPDGRVYGNRTRMKVVKNKVAPPFRECEFDILHAEGISNEGSLVDAALETKFVEKRGAWYTYNGESIGQGRDAARMWFKGAPDEANKLRKLVMDALAQQEETAFLPKGKKGRAEDITVIPTVPVASTQSEDDDGPLELEESTSIDLS